MNAPASNTPAPLPLSVSIVCCNNARTIGRTLSSVRGLAREIVAVDSGSSDGTLALLEEAGARVIHQDWLGFVKQKQFALDACTQEWVLHLDSDESVEPGLAEAIRSVIDRSESAADCYAINRMVWWNDAPLEHAWQPEYRLRLVRRGKARWGGYDPHDAMEPIEPGTPAQRLPRSAIMRHDSIDTITDFLAKQASHARVAAASYRAMGKSTSVLRLAASPVGEWCKQMIARGAWKDGWRGWAASSASAAAALMKHAALLEAQHTSKQDHPSDPSLRRERV